MRADLAPDRSDLAALGEHRDFLLSSLEDLEREREAGDIGEADYRELADDYTARAADVLRAIEARRVRTASIRSPDRPWRRTVALAGLVVAIAVAAGFLVAQASGQRAPGDTFTGDVEGSTRDDLAQAVQLAAQGEVLEAIMLYDEVLEIDPDNVEALTYRGWLLVLATPELLDDGLGWLDRAVETDPGYSDARAFRAIVYSRLGRTDEALAELDAFDASDPSPALVAQIEPFRRELEAESAG